MPLNATHASLVLARLGKQAVVVSPAGAVVRASDGELLRKGPFRSADNAPVAVGDTVYVSGRGAYKLALDKEGDLKVETLWGASGGGGERGPGPGGQKRYPSPLVHELSGLRRRSALRPQ